MTSFLEMHFTWGPNYTYIINLFLYLQDVLFALVLQNKACTKKKKKKSKQCTSFAADVQSAQNHCQSRYAGIRSPFLSGELITTDQIYKRGTVHLLTCCKWCRLKKGNKKHKWSSERKDKKKKNTPERKDRVGKEGWRKKKHEYILSSPSGCCFA